MDPLDLQMDCWAGGYGEAKGCEFEARLRSSHRSALAVYRPGFPEDPGALIQLRALVSSRYLGRRAVALRSRGVQDFASPRS